MAEKEGFEPSIPFWGIHDFQSCALGQLRDFSKSALDSLSILYHNFSFVKRYFHFSPKNRSRKELTDPVKMDII